MECTQPFPMNWEPDALEPYLDEPEGGLVFIVSQKFPPAPTIAIYPDTFCFFRYSIKYNINRAKTVVQYLRLRVPFSKQAPDLSAYPKRFLCSLRNGSAAVSLGREVSPYEPKPTMTSAGNTGHESTEAGR